jgi:RNA polymerase sigma-70 factor (ECF subfamily)
LIEEKEDILINACINGDREAQNKLYNLYSSRMFSVCFRYSRTKEEAEDTFHEGFMKVFKNLEKFNKTGSLESWIKRIMVNTAIDKYRKNLHNVSEHKVDISYLDLNLQCSEEVHDKINAEEIMQLVQKLPPGYRIVFNLYAIEGFKHREIAEKLGISEGTSKSNLSDARILLKKALLKYNSETDKIYINEGRK